MLKGYREWFPKHSLWPQTWGSSSFLSVLLGSFFSLLSFFFPLHFYLNEKKKTPWFLTCWPDKSGVLVICQVFEIFIRDWTPSLSIVRMQTFLSHFSVLKGDLLCPPGINPWVVNHHIIWLRFSFHYRHHPLLHFALQHLLELLPSEGIEERMKYGGPVGHH